MKKIEKKIQAKSAFYTEGYQVGIGSLNGEALPALDRVRAKPFGHGGARLGAGRKRSNRRPVVLRLSAATIKKLGTAARKKGLNRSAAAEEYLSRILVTYAPR